MFKVIAMMKLKPGVSFEEFRRHYETIHAPMGLKSLANTKRYFRHYLHPVSELGMDKGLTEAIVKVAANPGVLGGPKALSSTSSFTRTSCPPTLNMALCRASACH